MATLTAKIEAARRQLGTALALYLQDQDPVSVHCLAGGGCELIEYYAQKAGGEPFSSHALATFPDLSIGQLRKLQRQHWTAFKHATHLGGQERNDDELLSGFTDLQNDHALFIGWYDYAVVANAMPIEAQVHQIWYLALYPEKLDPAHSVEPIEAMFPDLRSQPRVQQKRMLMDRIKMARSDAQLMNDPKTEKRPLIIGWP
jgi:hypothetical protein